MDDVDAFAAELHREYLNGPISEEGWKQLKEVIGETANGREYEWNKVKGLQFDRSVHEKCEDSEECKTFLKQILEQLKIRFKSKEKVKALDIFDPRSVPVNKEQLDSYGISELRQLFDFYTKRKKITKNGVESTCEPPLRGSNGRPADFSVLAFEWKILRKELFDFRTDLAAKSKLSDAEECDALEAFYAKILEREEGQGRYSDDMVFLISMYLCLVTSSVGAASIAATKTSNSTSRIPVEYQ